MGAQLEARSLGHGWIGTEHLLLAFLGRRATPASAGPCAAGLDTDASVRAEVLAALGPGVDDDDRRCATSASTWTPSGAGSSSVRAGRPGRSAARRCRGGGLRRALRWRRRPGARRGRRAGHIPFTPRAKKSLELALREALAQHSREIRTEHLGWA